MDSYNLIYGPFDHTLKQVPPPSHRDIETYQFYCARPTMQCYIIEDSFIKNSSSTIITDVDSTITNSHSLLIENAW